MPCSMTQHQNNLSILRWEKHDISLRILHQAGFETARQVVTLAKFRALTIAPQNPLVSMVYTQIIQRFKG